MQFSIVGIQKSKENDFTAVNIELFPRWPFYDFQSMTVNHLMLPKHSGLFKKSVDNMAACLLIS